VGLWQWIVTTLRSYPELAIFLALGMIQEAAKSKVPALGYGMPYAIGNTLLTIFGMVIVLLLAGGS